MNVGQRIALWLVNVGAVKNTEEYWDECKRFGYGTSSKQEPT